MIASFPRPPAPRRLLATTISCLLVAGLASAAKAAGSASYHVDMVTTALTGGIYTGPYMMDFQFIDGGGSSGEPNNVATISNFAYGGGTGSTNTITLNDGIVPGPGEATVNFSAGTRIDFDLNVTTNQDSGAGATPDSFSFAILDANENPIPTTDPGDAFFYVTESGDSLKPAPLVQTFSASDGHGGMFSPTVTSGSASAPEPSNLAYFVVSAFGAGCVLLRKQKRTTGNASRRLKRNTVQIKAAEPLDSHNLRPEGARCCHACMTWNAPLPWPSGCGQAGIQSYLNGIAFQRAAPLG